MAQQQERYHSLDFLRATAMFLGILLHAAISFMTTAPPFWPAKDVDPSPAADLFIFIVHGFRMQVFFLLAGFFGCLLYERYGLTGMIKHRLSRIVVPLALALVTVVPALEALWLLGNPAALRYLGLVAGVDQPPLERLADYLLAGRIFEQLPLMHLWFLWYLLLFFALMIVLLGFGRVLTGTWLQRRMDVAFRWILGLPGKSLILAAITTPLVWPMKVWGMVDTPESWTPSPAIGAYYFLFFLFGWVLWRQRDRLGDFSQRWQGSLLLGTFAILPAMLYVVFKFIDAHLGKAPLPGDAHHLAACYLAALYTWLMVGGLIGAFRHYFANERRWVRYLADASYWCYLWHLTLIVGLQILLASSPLPGIIKFAVILLITFAILLATYEWCVRYTLIGAILNGRKVRCRRSEAANQRLETRTAGTEAEDQSAVVDDHRSAPEAFVRPASDV